MEIRTYPPQVFARLAPDVYFQRNIEANERPTCRNFLERRPIDLTPADDNTFPHSLGSAIAKCGESMVICGITGGLTNFIGEGGIYANIEIPRYSTKLAPSEEEQVITERIDELIKCAKISKDNFYVSDQQELCLNAEIIVVSRTGPTLDIAWACLVEALRNTKVPIFEQDERTLQMIPTEESRPLQLPPTLAPSSQSYGVYENTVFADVDGPVEEEIINNQIIVVRKNQSELMGFSLTCPDGCSLENVAKVLEESRKNFK